MTTTATYKDYRIRINRSKVVIEYPNGTLMLIFDMKNSTNEERTAWCIQKIERKIINS
jgi:hypothetical protein